MPNKPTYEELEQKVRDLEQRHTRFAQIENQLQDEIAWRRLLLQQSQDGIVILDQNCRVYESNQRFAAMLGYSEAETAQLHVWDWDYLHDKDQILALSHEVTNTNHRLTTKFRRKDGSIIGVELSNNGLVYKGQKLIFCVCRDVTEQLNAQALLKTSEEKFRTAFETSPDAINLTRMDGTYVDVNEGFLRLTGYTKDEVVGKSSLELNIWKNHADRDRLVRGLQDKGYVENLDAEFLAKDGRVIDGLMSGKILDIGDEKIILTITRDITDRKLTEEKYKTVVSEANAGIALADAQTGEIIECNQSLADMVERSREDIIGQPQAILHPEEHLSPDGVTYHFAKRREFPDVQTIAQQCVTSSGKRIDVEIRAKRIEYAGRQMLLGIFYDISEMLHLQNQLRQKYKMEAIGVMAGGIAHNFNNTLAVILGSLELSKLKKDQPEKLVHFLDTAIKAVMRSRDLVSQILTYSRLDSYKRGPTDLTMIVDETMNLLRSALPTTIQIEYLSDLDKKTAIIADSSQVQEALLNLCNNASFSMNEKGTLKIHLSLVTLQKIDIPAQYKCPPGHYVQLSVQDSGCGIPHDILDSIFDPFFTTKETGEGTGMGLATVQGIMSQHDGFITVSSTVGQGSTFKLYFPNIEGSETVNIQKKDTPLPRGHEKILLIDDDEELVNIGREMLTTLGYQVTAKTNAHEALKIFTSDPNHFDLIITDQTMPILTGKDLLKAMKTVHPTVRSILLTGYSSQIDKQEAEELGINAYCMKPLNLPEFSKTIRRILDQA